MITKRTKTTAGTALLLLLALAVDGCASRQHAREREDSDRSLAFGYLDTRESNTVLDSFRFAANAPGRKDDGLEARVVGSDDAFFLENMKSGSYRLSLFVTRLGAASYTQFFPQAGPGVHGFKIDKPGLHYLGAYKYKRAKTGFNQYKFELIPLTSPNQKEVLQKILPHTKGTQWEDVIRKRLREL
jgi:hypothetical protein